LITNKEGIILIIIYSVLLGIFWFILKDKIEFFYILILTLSLGGVIKSACDIKNKTGNQKVYIWRQNK